MDTPKHNSPLALVACALVAVAAGGCGASKLGLLKHEVEFNEQVLRADRPVVVEFYKPGCAGCLFSDPMLDQLVDEYGDRVIFVRFELANFWGQIASESIWKKYRVAFFPTVLLFVGGREKHRWVVDYNGGAYRKVLDEVAGPPPPNKPAAGGRGVAAM